jgi:hypothetical protein
MRAVSAVAGTIAEMVDDILLCSKGELAQLIRVARQAVSDWRDVKVAAAEIRTVGKSN